MEIIENLPKRVVQPYRSMTIQQQFECDDVPPDELVGIESIHNHLKLYKSLFKTVLTESKDVLQKSPTDGAVAAPSKAKFGAYNTAEMKKFVGWALMDGLSGSRCCWLTLEPSGGKGKTENATRQVVNHPELVEWGLMDYVDRQWKERIFSEVAGTNMTKVRKVFADLRDQLGIPYLDDFGQRRLLHSIRHSVCSPAMAGWVKNILHLLQTVGYEKSCGITKRYLHTFPLPTVCYVVDGISWV